MRLTYKEEILNELSDISEEELQKILKMIHFIKVEILLTKKPKGNKINKAIEAVEKSRGSFHVDKKILQYFAENKEIEYEY